MFQGYPSQFPNGMPNNAQQVPINPLIKSPILPTIQTSSSSIFQINNDIQIPQPINIIVQQPNQQVQQQNKSKQLTIQQSLQQTMPQPLQNQQQHQIQNAINHHPVPQLQQSLQQSALQQQTIHHHPLPIPQQQIIRPVITSPSGVQIQQERRQVQSSNNNMTNQAHIINQQISPGINLPRVDISKIAHQIVTSPSKQNIMPETNHSLNKDSNQSLYNILQQFAPQASPEPSLVYDDEFQVEGIADEREVKGKTQYLVQWAGFSDDENTWEDESNLSRYYQLINDFRMNGPKPRSQRRIVDFISGFVSNGKVNYNVLYQNDEVGTLTALQARGSRVKQHLINFLEREFTFPEKERIIIPPKPKQPRSPSNPSDGQKQTTSSAAGLSEYDYEYVEEEEEIENGETTTDDGENKKIKKRIKRKKRVVLPSTDEPGSAADTESKNDGNNEINDELKMQKKILQDDPIEVSSIYDL